MVSAISCLSLYYWYRLMLLRLLPPSYYFYFYPYSFVPFVCCIYGSSCSVFTLFVFLPLSNLSSWYYELYLLCLLAFNFNLVIFLLLPFPSISLSLALPSSSFFLPLFLGFPLPLNIYTLLSVFVCWRYASTPSTPGFLWVFHSIYYRVMSLMLFIFLSSVFRVAYYSFFPTCTSLS